MAEIRVAVASKQNMQKNDKMIDLISHGILLSGGRGLSNDLY